MAITTGGGVGFDRAEAGRRNVAMMTDAARNLANVEMQTRAQALQAGQQRFMQLMSLAEASGNPEDFLGSETGKLAMADLQGLMSRAEGRPLTATEATQGAYMAASRYYANNPSMKSYLDSLARRTRGLLADFGPEQNMGQGGAKPTATAPAPKPTVTDVNGKQVPVPPGYRQGAFSSAPESAGGMPINDAMGTAPATPPLQLRDNPREAARQQVERAVQIQQGTVPSSAAYGPGYTTTGKAIGEQPSTPMLGQPRDALGAIDMFAPGEWNRAAPLPAGETAPPVVAGPPPSVPSAPPAAQPVPTEPQFSRPYGAQPDFTDAEIQAWRARQQQRAAFAQREAGIVTNDAVSRLSSRLPGPRAIPQAAPQGPVQTVGPETSQSQIRPPMAYGVNPNAMPPQEPGTRPAQSVPMRDAKLPPSVQNPAATAAAVADSATKSNLWQELVEHQQFPDSNRPMSLLGQKIDKGVKEIVKKGTELVDKIASGIPSTQRDKAEAAKIMNEFQSVSERLRATGDKEALKEYNTAKKWYENASPEELYAAGLPEIGNVRLTRMMAAAEMELEWAKTLAQQSGGGDLSKAFDIRLKAMGEYNNLVKTAQEGATKTHKGDVKKWLAENGAHQQMMDQAATLAFGREVATSFQNVVKYDPNAIMAFFQRSLDKITGVPERRQGLGTRFIDLNAAAAPTGNPELDKLTTQLSGTYTK